jgi:hypothetical protein
MTAIFMANPDYLHAQMAPATGFVDERPVVQSRGAAVARTRVEALES